MTSGWVLFYGRASEIEEYGYMKRPVVYKHRSSANRAARELFKKLPFGIEWRWYVTFMENEKETQ